MYNAMITHTARLQCIYNSSKDLIYGFSLVLLHTPFCSIWVMDLPLSMAMVIYYMAMWMEKGPESLPGSNRLMSE